MTSIEGHITLKHRRPGPHSESRSCQRGRFRFQHLVLRCRPLATHRDHLGRGLVGCMSSVDNVCVKEKETEKEREMTDSLARLSAATRFPLRLLSRPSPVPLVSPNFCTPQVLFWRPAECPSDRDCKGKARRESRDEARAHFPRCSWLLSAPEDLSEHFQNKEFVCVGAQIANPRIYAHLHTDRDTLTLGHKKCYSNSF